MNGILLPDMSINIKEKNTPSTKFPGIVKLLKLTMNHIIYKIFEFKIKNILTLFTNVLYMELM